MVRTVVRRKKVTVGGVISSVKDTSQKRRYGTGHVVLAMLVAAGVGGAVFRPAPRRVVSAPNEVSQLEMFANVNHPLAAMDVTIDQFNQLDSQGKLTHIYASLEKYDYWLQARSKKSMTRSMAVEAERLKREAAKEIRQQKYSTVDPLSSIDLKACESEIPPVRCVLIRYAGDGIAQYANGVRTDDIYETNRGYIRFRASLLALSDFDIPSGSNDDIPTGGLVNYRATILLALKNSPVSLKHLDIPYSFGSDTPAEALEKSFPLRSSTTPVGEATQNHGR